MFSSATVFLSLLYIVDRWMLPGIMDELKRFRISCRRYRSQTTKLLSGVQQLLTSDPFAVNAEVISTIEHTLEQLQRKQTILEELDTKIAPLITEESGLEEEMMEAEDTRVKILHGITRLKSHAKPHYYSS